MAKTSDKAVLEAEVAKLKAKLLVANDALKREPVPWGIAADRTYTREEAMLILGIHERTWQRMLADGLPYTKRGGLSGRLYQVWSEALHMIPRSDRDNTPGVETPATPTTHRS